jgi:hypothetical protein
MVFRCPQCTKATLAIKSAIELPPDSRSDEITLQVVSCGVCGFLGIAVYQESRRGALDSESWEHNGYRVAKVAVAALARVIRSCPNRRDARCQCAAHRRLSATDCSGRWQFPPEMQGAELFPMYRT